MQWKTKATKPIDNSIKTSPKITAMKKFILFCLTLACLTSCQQDVQFNNPSFQGLKNNNFWRASSSKAQIKDGLLIVKGYYQNEELTLSTNVTDLNTYPLGAGAASTAIYEIIDPTNIETYTTNSESGNGYIVINEYDTANKTISGTFKFNAATGSTNATAADIVNFQQGVFYKIPIQP